MMRFVGLILACFILPSWASADIAPNPLSGGVNFTGTTDKVAMSEETVTLKVSPTRCTTNAVFLMKNLTDEPVTIDVGFPFAYPSDLQEFRVKVDGKAMKNVAEKTKGKRQKWKVWTMTFPASKVTKVQVDYWNSLKANYSWVSSIRSGHNAVDRLLLSFTAFKQKPRGEATEDDEGHYKQLGERLRHGEVNYILTTGAGWAGHIGKCKIEAKFEGFTDENLITRYPIENEEYLPRDPQVNRDGLVWELKDFEPRHDIYFSITPNITRSELKELIETTLKDHPHHPSLTMLLGDYCDFPNEKTEHEKLMDDMLVHWSTRLAIDGPDYIDRDHAQQSFKVWFAVRKMTFGKLVPIPVSDARRQKLLPTFKAMALRMQSQLPKDALSSDRLNKHQVKTFRSDVSQLLNWVEEQK